MATSNMSIWVPIGGVSGLVCMVFTALLWAEVKPPWTKQRGGTPVTRQFEAKSIWVGSLLTISLTLLGGATFAALHAQRPLIAWIVVACLGVTDAILWFVLLRVPGTASERADNDELEADQRRREKTQLEGELWRSQESRRMCDEERREVLRELKEMKLVLSPLQLESLQLAKELRDLYASLGPCPDDVLNSNETDPAKAAEAMTARSLRKIKWQPETPLRLCE